MHQTYATRGIVLARTHIAEASTLVTVLTQDLGLVRGRAQGLRKSGAKLAVALTTLAESDLTFIRGKEAWRLSGAILAHNWMESLTREARVRAARVAGLILRFVSGEVRDPAFFDTFSAFLRALTTLSDDDADAAECLAVLRILHALGLDTGGLPGAHDEYSPEALALIAADRKAYVNRINRGIEASGL
jgi:DNA repair protein RecO